MTMARRAASAPRTQGWERMREGIAAQLEKKTGEGLPAWRNKMSGMRFENEAALRRWAKAQGVTGYPVMLLVWERFGYPDYLTTDAATLIDGQYADRPALRPIYEALIAALPGLGEVTVQARKTYVSLVSPKRTFAVIQATTRSRVDLGLRLPSQKPSGRLVPAGSVGNGSMTLRIGLTSKKDVGAETLRWLRHAYDANAR